MNRLWGALAGVVAAVALVLACSGLVSAADASAPSRSGPGAGTSAGAVTLADSGVGNVTDTGWGGGGWG